MPVRLPRVVETAVAASLEWATATVSSVSQKFILPARLFARSLLDGPDVGAMSEVGEERVG